MAPSLFASPFITPYMPQQPSNPLPDSAQPSNFQPNLPSSVAYFLQSVQYQEVMQQYFNLMAAATSQTALDLSRQVSFLQKYNATSPSDSLFAKYVIPRLTTKSYEAVWHY